MPRPMSDDGARQSLRGFVSALKQALPGEVVRISEPVDLAYQTQALALELERRRRFPVLIFEQVRGHSIPVVSNVMARRRGRATALGVGEAQLPEEYAKRLKEPLKPVVLDRPPFHVDVQRGDDAVDLGAMPIPQSGGGPSRSRRRRSRSSRWAAGSSGSPCSSGGRRRSSSTSRPGPRS